MARIEADAAAAGLTVFATWHSREAAGVTAARVWLADRKVESADLRVPDGRMAPLAADISMACGHIPATASFDFLHEGPQQWDIVVDTDGGRLVLRMGGAILEIDAKLTQAHDAEYGRLYAKFDGLIGSGRSDVDMTPLRLVADAFLVGRRDPLPAFAW